MQRDLSLYANWLTLLQLGPNLHESGAGAQATGATIGGAGARLSGLRRRLRQEEIAVMGQESASLSSVSWPVDLSNLIQHVLVQTYIFAEED